MAFDLVANYKGTYAVVIGQLVDSARTVPVAKVLGEGCRGCEELGGESAGSALFPGVGIGDELAKCLRFTGEMMEVD